MNSLKEKEEIDAYKYIVQTDCTMDMQQHNEVTGRNVNTIYAGGFA